MKVLVSAYACEPGKGSEPYVGWTWVEAISKTVEQVHVLTRANNRETIEAALRMRAIPNVRFHYFDLPRWARFWKHWTLGIQLYYILWQYKILPMVRRLHDEIDFDAVHHLTFASMIYPPGVAHVPVPFIWGPTGFHRSPDVLRRSLHLRARLSESFHDGLHLAALTNPTVRRAFERARIIFRLPRASLLHPTGGMVIPAGNIFVNPHAESAPRPYLGTGPLHLVSAFRMIFLKGADLGIEAVALLKRKGVRIKWSLVGDGPERPRWQALARRLGVQDDLHFLGWLPWEDVLSVMRTGDVLLHPSFREGWGGAVLEAMAHGLPVVCLDWGGPGFIVDNNSGIRVPVGGSRREIVEGIAAALERLHDPSLRQHLGNGARERVRDHFSLAALDRLAALVYGSVAQ